jgi:hypothetical protein
MDLGIRSGYVRMLCGYMNAYSGGCGWIRVGTVRRRKAGEGSGTYFVRWLGCVLLASASSEARAADVFLFKMSVA